MFHLSAGTTAGEQREQRCEPKLLVDLLDQRGERQMRIRDRRQAECLEGHAFDPRWRLFRRSLMVIRADRWDDNVDSMAASAVSPERLEERRRAALTGQGPDLQRADHEDSQRSHSPLFASA